MAISLAKTKTPAPAPQKRGLEFVTINLYWDRRATFGKEYDLDISCFLLQANGKLAAEDDFVFYNNTSSVCGSAIYYGDNTAGASLDNDGEAIDIDFPKLPPEIAKIAIAASIHKGAERGQAFGMAEHARVSIVNRATGRQLAFFQLSEAFAHETAVIVCEFYRDGGQWKFRSLDAVPAADLGAIVRHYGGGVE